MSNFKTRCSANFQLFKKPENRKTASMLEFGDLMIGKHKGRNGAVSDLQGLTWFLRAGKAMAAKAEKGRHTEKLLEDCDALIEKLDKHYKGKDGYANLFETAYQIRAKVRAALNDAEGAAQDSAKAEEYGKIAAKARAMAEACQEQMAKFRSGDYEGLLADYAKALEADSGNAHKYRCKMGYVKYEMGYYAGAVEEYTAAISLKPDYAYAYYQRSQAKYAMGDREGSIADCDRAIAFDPGNAEAYVSRGHAKKGWEVRDLAGAVDDFTTAIELLKGKPETLENLKMLRNALAWRSRAKLERSEVSGLFYVSNQSGWKADDTDAAALTARITAMEKKLTSAQKKEMREGCLSPALF